MREKIFQEIERERAYQDTKYGTGFDDKNTVNDWQAYINRYLATATTVNVTREQQRTAVLKAAAIAVAALETFDRNRGFARRHYDSIV